MALFDGTDKDVEMLEIGDIAANARRGVSILWTAASSSA
jgi:hypothetical protein